MNADQQAFVSVVVPARDEERSLGLCLDSILTQHWPGDRLQVLVVENGSRDRTRDVAEAWAARDPRVSVVVSRAANHAEAMNVGIQAARGEIVARVDAHSHIDRRYVAEVVAAFDRHPGAAVVGGAFLAAGETPCERVAGFARSSRLGVGGGYGTDRIPHDHPVRSVQCGAYRREALLAVGGFDPAMAYGEDEDLNWRLRQRGFEVILCPALLQHYRPRASLGGLWRQYWNYGRGRMRVLRKHPDFLAPRHLAPSALVVVLAGLAAAGAVVPAAHAALSLVAVAWGAILAGAACSARGARWRERLLLPCAVAGMHLAYGAGLLRESVRRSSGAPSGPAGAAGVPVPRPAPRVTLSVVICTKDRPEMLATCLESLRHQTRRPEEIVVVDASATPARDVVDRLAENMRGCRVALSKLGPRAPSPAEPRGARHDRIGRRLPGRRRRPGHRVPGGGRTRVRGGLHRADRRCRRRAGAGSDTTGRVLSTHGVPALPPRHVRPWCPQTVRTSRPRVLGTFEDGSRAPFRMQHGLPARGARSAALRRTAGRLRPR